MHDMLSRVCSALILLGLLSLVGCGPNTSEVSGTVTFEGQPVPEGDIIFSDEANKIAPDASKIKDGKFKFTAKLGKKKVQIQAVKMEKLPPGKKGAMGETEIPVGYIP